MTKSKTKRNMYITLAIVTLLLVAIGYALLNSNLSINGNTKLKKNTWDIHFENLEESSDSVNSTISEIDKDMTIRTSVTLSKPGDFYEYSVDIANDGSVDGMIDSITGTGLTEEQKKYISYSYKYKDGNYIKSKQILKSNTKRTLVVRIEYRKDIASTDLPNEDKEVNLDLNINYIQADDSAIEVTDY